MSSDEKKRKKKKKKKVSSRSTSLKHRARSTGENMSPGAPV